MKKQLFSLLGALFFLSAQQYDYDLIVIGAGCSGMTIAAYAALLCNKRVMVLDKQEYGGNMLWSYDFPLNLLAQEAENYYNAQHSDYLYAPESIDQKAFFILYSDKLKTKQQLLFQKLYYFLFHDIRINFIKGSPKVINEHTVSILDTLYTAQKIVIATGVVPTIPDIKGIDTVDYLEGKNVIPNTKQCTSLLIIGSGVLAVQLAFIYAQLGSKVIILSRNDNFLKNFDQTIKGLISARLRQLGVVIVYNVEVQEIKKKDGGVMLEAIIHQKTINYEADQLAIAVGVKASIDGLGLEDLNVQLHNGFICVDQQYKILNSSLYAFGAVTGKLFNTRTIHLEAKKFLYQLYKLEAFSYLKELKFNTVYKFPYSPHCAYKGLTEQEAQKKYGNDIKIYHFSFEQSEQAHIDNAINGMAKFICTHDGILVGVHVFGKQAGELIDFVPLGEPFYDVFLKEKDKTFPGYYNILVRAAHLCFRDMKNIDGVTFKKNSFQKIKDYMYEAFSKIFK